METPDTEPKANGAHDRGPRHTAADSLRYLHAADLAGVALQKLTGPKPDPDTAITLLERLRAETAYEARLHCGTEEWKYTTDVPVRTTGDGGATYRIRYPDNSTIHPVSRPTSRADADTEEKAPATAATANEGEAPTYQEDAMTKSTPIAGTIEQALFDTLAGYAFEKLFPTIPMPGDPDDPITLQHLAEALDILADLETPENVFNVLTSTINGPYNFPALGHVVASLRGTVEEGDK